MGKFDFSVSMCVYGGDRAEYFDLAMESVVTQTLLPTEIVLTVDGPIPDEIENVIRKYERELKKTPISFRVVRLERNMGLGEARRIGLARCSCELIALMDADDLSIPVRFEKQVGYFINHPDVSAVGGQIAEFIPLVNPSDVSKIAGIRIVPETDSEIKDYMKKRCPMNHVTVMLKKRDVDAVGGYLDWYYDEDYYLWLRLALAGKKFGNIPENLVSVRVGEEMYQRRGGLKYFLSEARLQRFMLKNKLIGLPRYVINVGERLVLQVLMPNKMRGWVFQKFARARGTKGT